LYASGQPLGLPHIKEPTNADIDKWHAIYCGQVERLFEKYKEKVPAYKHKKLVIE
jgi:2-acylglycerol O-acyltransferase 2